MRSITSATGVTPNFFEHKASTWVCMEHSEIKKVRATIRAQIDHESNSASSIVSVLAVSPPKDAARQLADGEKWMAQQEEKCRSARSSQYIHHSSSFYSSSSSSLSFFSNNNNNIFLFFMLLTMMIFFENSLLGNVCTLMSPTTSLVECRW